VLKILTLNLNYDYAGFGPWPERRAQIHALLQTERPNIVALQAVHVSPDRDQTEELADACHYHHKLFLAATESIPHQGSALLSDIPLSAPWSYALPRQDRDEDPSFRRAIGATFAWQGEVWQFTNAHFSWIAHQNLRQTQALTAALQAFPGPQCLVGDFNAAPDAAGIQHPTDSGWVDTFERQGQGQGLTFPANDSLSRIDYIFLHDVEAPRIAEVRVVPTDNQAVSDHRGVILTLRPAGR
jgi:endonuclease/exonuclease/phosphatase family metal-dependent hydrolase